MEGAFSPPICSSLSASLHHIEGTLKPLCHITFRAIFSLQFFEYGALWHPLNEWVDVFVSGVLVSLRAISLILGYVCPNFGSSAAYLVL